MSIIEQLKWRYATKRFDPEKQVSNTDLETLKEAIRLAPSSYGLQLTKVLIINDRSLREKLVPATWGQEQIRDASHVFVFCSFKGALDDQIDAFTRMKESALEREPTSMKGYAEFIKMKLQDVPEDGQGHWMAKQNYIALGQLLTTCSLLEIDACPIEGFEPEEYDRILGLSEMQLKADVVVAIGYRSSDDPAQHNPKVRKPADDLFIDL